MARTTEQLLEHAKRLAPAAYHANEAHMGCLAAQAALAERVIDDLAEQATIGGARGIWLRLRAKSSAVQPADGEDDDTLRARIRNIADAVTAPAIEAAVNAILLPYEVTCLVVPHWMARPYCDDGADEYRTDLFCDGQNLLGVRNGASCIVPTGLPEPVYSAIVNEIVRLQDAAGLWWLIIEDDFDPATDRLPYKPVT